MAVPAEFIEELRSRVRLSELIGKQVKLTPKGGRMSGLCPFHTEKSPSFSVNDAEGFYHCFGCGVSGDAISYLRDSEGLTFMESLHQLAEIAGMQVPLSAPVDPQRVEKRKQAIDVCEAATGFFQTALKSDAGKKTKDYLDSRGISDEMIAEFRLGYAPQKGLFSSLQQRQFSKELIIEAGLAGVSERDKSLYDYFRNRVMFPIQNRQAKIIAFGARALGDAQPKYLNSPEGPSFSKKAVLYGWPQARVRLKEGIGLLVVEGYMDVIAVTASGVAAALAPLGTALSEQQIQLIWRLHQEPVLCFDGDMAGQKAAGRAIERILPLLEPGRTVRIAVLPAGQDPDDILKVEGPDGLRQIIDSASGILDSVWDRKFTQYRLSDARTQPGARAAFWTDLRQLVRTISHNQTRTAYLDDLEFRISSMRAAYKKPGGTGDRRGYSREGPYLIPKRPKTGRIVQYQAVLAILIRFPELFVDFAEPLTVTEFSDKKLEKLKKSIIDHLIDTPDLDALALRHHLQLLGYDDQLDALFSNNMKERFGFDPADLSSMKAKDYINGILGRLAQKVRRRK